MYPSAAQRLHLWTNATDPKLCFLIFCCYLSLDRKAAESSRVFIQVGHRRRLVITFDVNFVPCPTSVSL